MPHSPATPRQLRVPFYVVLILLLILGVTACNDTESAVAPEPASPELSRFSVQAADRVIPGRYIIEFVPGVKDPEALGKALAGAHGGAVGHVYRHALQGFSVAVPEQALEGIRRNPNVRSIEPDRLLDGDEIQSSATWGIDRINQRSLPLDHSYSYTANGAGVTAYIFDSGIRFDHAEFEGRAVRGYDAMGDGWNGEDCVGHGTHVAGTVGGKTYGVAKGVKLVSVRVLGCDNYGSYSGMIAGIDWVLANNRGPAVANFSLGGPKSDALNRALTTMIDAGIQTAVSAGNDGGDSCVKSPASTLNALTVGATTSADARATYSNYGTCVDLFAPGSGITSASYASTTGTRSMSGTSMAAPHVTGVLALLLSEQPGLTAQQLRTWVYELTTRNAVVNALSTNAHLVYSLSGGSSAPEPPTVEPPPSDPPVAELPPSDPTSLKAAASGKSNAKVTWSDRSTNEQGFRVERQVSSGTWQVLATLGANSTSFTDAKLQRGQTYAYRVQAFNGAGPSGYSNTASLLIGAATAKGNGR